MQFNSFLNKSGMLALCGLFVLGGCVEKPESDPVSVESITLDQETMTLTVGETGKLTATVTPENVTNLEIVWSSADETVVQVAQDGTVTAVAAGSTSVSVTANPGAKTASCTVTVNAPEPVSVESVTLDQETMTLTVGETGKLTATVTPENVTNLEIVWSSADETVVQVAQDGTVTAVAAGTTSVSVTANPGAKTASCTVTVNAPEPEKPEIETVEIKAGTFMMGSPESEADRGWDEDQMEVTLTRDFRMSKYEITNAQYAEFLNGAKVGQDGLMPDWEYTDKPLFVTSDFYGITYDAATSSWTADERYKDYPVVYVTWYGALAFAQWIGGDLPTEAQWEYACRAGSGTAYCFGDDVSMLGDYAWYEDNAASLQPVGQKKPNAWGLYDMHGNVYEFCKNTRGLFGEYETGQTVDPVPVEGEYFATRSSSYDHSAANARSAYRSLIQDGEGSRNLGIRVIFYD